jgi:hypothetical protein
MGESSSAIIEQLSKAALLAIWHQRYPWRSREEAEEDFDLYLSLALAEGLIEASSPASRPTLPFGWERTRPKRTI